MIHTYVINVEGHNKRLADVRQSLSLKGIEVKRIKAVTPEDMRRIGFKSDCDIYYPSMLPPACLVSHLKTLMTFLSEHESGDHALILEDDVALAPALTAERLRSLPLNAPKDFEILQLGTSHAKGSYSLLEHRKKSSLQWHNWHYALWGAFAYLVTEQGAERIIERLFSSCILDLSGFYCPELCVADYLLYEICKTYTSTYPWFGHTGHDSTVRSISEPRERQLMTKRDEFLRTCWHLD